MKWVFFYLTVIYIFVMDTKKPKQYLVCRKFSLLLSYNSVEVLFNSFENQVITILGF